MACLIGGDRTIETNLSRSWGSLHPPRGPVGTAENGARDAEALPATRVAGPQVNCRLGVFTLPARLGIVAIDNGLLRHGAGAPAGSLDCGCRTRSAASTTEM